MKRSKAPPRKSKSNVSDAAWQRAIRLLTARDRSVHALRGRLSAVGEAPATIEPVIRRLQAVGYLNDERFAHGVAERWARRGHGSERVRAELEQQGIAPALVDAALMTAFVDERGLAHHALVRKFPSPLRTATERAKAAHFLLNRGFPESIVLAIVGEGC